MRTPGNDLVETSEDISRAGAGAGDVELRFAGFTVLWFVLGSGVLPGVTAWCVGRRGGSTAWAAAAVLGMQLAMLAVYFPMARRTVVSWRELAKLLQIGIWRRAWLWQGPLLAAGLVLAVGAVTWLWRAAAARCGIVFDVPRSLEILQSGDPAARFPLIVLALLIAPFWEEAAFRNGLFRLLRLRLPYAASAILTGGVFALMHGSGLQFPGLLLLALVWQYARERSGSLWSSVWLHFCNNLWAVTLLGFLRTGG